MMITNITNKNTSNSHARVIVTIRIAMKIVIIVIDSNTSHNRSTNTFSNDSDNRDYAHHDKRKRAELSCLQNWYHEPAKPTKSPHAAKNPRSNKAMDQQVVFAC